MDSETFEQLKRSEGEQPPSEHRNEIVLKLSHASKSYSFPISSKDSAVTLTDLRDQIATWTNVPPENQKLILPRGKRFPRASRFDSKNAEQEDESCNLWSFFSQTAVATGSILPKEIKIMVIGTSDQVAAKIASVKPDPGALGRRNYKHEFKVSKSSVSSSSRVHSTEDIQYTFHELQPLSILPFPEKSLAVLERLRADRGVQATMKKHKLSVGLLTELDPASNTTRESKLLGLNTNYGEKIELRLRTDAYDGYRDYKTVRSALCHELAHNRFGDHDRDFHDFWNLLERDAQRLDPFSTESAHRLSNKVFYDGPISGDSAEEQRDGEAAREIMFRAAERRMQKDKHEE